MGGAPASRGSARLSAIPFEGQARGPARAPRVGWRVLGVFALLALASGLTAAATLFPRAPAAGAVPGLKFGGALLTPGAAIAPQIEARLGALRGRRVRLVLNEHAFIDTSLGELGLELDVEEQARRAHAVGRRGSWLTRIEERRAAQLGALDLPLHLKFDRARVAALLMDLKETTDRPGVDARFDLSRVGLIAKGERRDASRDAQPIVAHAPGVYLDLDASVESLLKSVSAGARDAQLVSKEIAPELNQAALERLDLSELVSEFSSRFSRGGDADNRATNIETAAKRLDGVVLPPGELVSFNALVGARTLENGFRPGWEIFRGEMVRGIGGGTCQVSSTLHAASVYGGLDVVERAPHSRPSAYMPLGLDSTVAWPSVDLKIKNPWPFPLVVHAVVSGNELRVQLLGQQKPADVRWHTETLAILSFKRKVTESSWLSEGTVIKKQKGIRGYRLRRIRELTLADGATRVEETIDVYPPTDEHFIVPRGAELAEVLPPPAEGSIEARELAARDQGTGEAGVVIATQAPFEP